MITTVSQVKTLLNITDTSEDARIAAYLPIVENDLITYCNNMFLVNTVSFSGEVTPTVAGAVYSFDVDYGFTDSNFQNNDVVYIAGTNRNDGYYTIVTVTDTKMTVDEPVVAETKIGSSIKMASFPAALEMIVARMIGYQLSHANDAWMQSETIKSYSYSRAAGGNSDAGYPAEILRGLDRYKVIKTGRSQRREQFIDRRGNYVATVITDDSLR